MIIIIAGDRNFGDHIDEPDPSKRGLLNDQDWTAFDGAMDKFVAKFGLPTRVVGGLARGADTLGERWAEKNRVDFKGFRALWNTEGRSAGPKRNQRMLDYLIEMRDEGSTEIAVIAFHRNIATSKGTKNMVEISRKAGVPVWIPIPQPQQTLGL